MRSTSQMYVVKLHQFWRILIDDAHVKARIGLKIEIVIGLKFNQSKERKPISSLVSFASIGQNPIQSQSQSLVSDTGFNSCITIIG